MIKNMLFAFFSKLFIFYEASIKLIFNIKKLLKKFSSVTTEQYKKQSSCSFIKNLT